MTRARVIELCAMLSLASDLGTGMPLEHGMRTAVLAQALAGAAGLPPPDRAAVAYVALLRSMGCTSTPKVSAAAGDEIDIGRLAFADGIDYGDPRAVFVWMVREYQAGMPLHERAAALWRGRAATPSALQAGRIGHCEVAQRFAARLGLGPAVTGPLADSYERWDGLGPRRRKGDGVPVEIRLIDLAMYVAGHYCIGGVEAAVEIAAARAGKTFDPAIAALVTRRSGVLDVLDAPSPWTVLVDAEPRPWRVADDAGVDAAAAIVADFADQKTPWFAGHSRRVADLAANAAGRCGIDDQGMRDVRNAGLIHDLGITGIATAVWERAGPLSDLEWERVRLHAYDTERIVGRVAALRPSAEIAGRHHERSDGSGYHRGVRAAAIPIGARLLAAAEVYDALLHERPFRRALAPAEAERTMTRLAREGKLDPASADAVLAAAGTRTSRRRSSWPDGLTDREVDVLRVAATGKSIRQIAAALAVRPKTVDTYLQRAYAKIGVSTRSAATLYVIEHGLTEG